MPFIKVYLHFVWSTKNREPFLATRQLREKTWLHIKQNGHQKGIFVDVVGGYTDHNHALISLGISQDIGTIMKLLKGESAHWLNKECLVTGRFEWQDDYFVVAVSESHIEAVRNYILNQEEHHGYKNFDEEYNEMKRKFGYGSNNFPPAEAGGINQINFQ